LRAEKLGIAHGAGTTPAPVIDSPSAKPHPEPSGFTPGGRPFYKFVGMEFVKVTAGDFYMGADDVKNASPQHLVYQLDYDFYIGRYPVTNQEYSLYLRTAGKPIIMTKEKAKHPAVNVSWKQAQDFVSWLNGKHQSDLLNGYKFHLPSEAEWEKAARGVEGNEYPWGNKFDAKKCNSKVGGKKGTTPVGTFSPQGDSAFGSADMVGNVWEWTRTLDKRKSSPFSYEYPYRCDDGREDLLVDDGIYEYIVRGGSFESDKTTANCIRRFNISSNHGQGDLGFRLAICPIKK
jgi:formylglycine-generating enzyme required for sulfatase activity